LENLQGEKAEAHSILERIQGVGQKVTRQLQEAANAPAGNVSESVSLQMVQLHTEIQRISGENQTLRQELQVLGTTMATQGAAPAPTILDTRQVEEILRQVFTERETEWAAKQEKWRKNCLANIVQKMEGLRGEVGTELKRVHAQEIQSLLDPLGQQLQQQVGMECERAKFDVQAQVATAQQELQKMLAGAQGSVNFGSLDPPATSHTWTHEAKSQGSPLRQTKSPRNKHHPKVLICKGEPSANPFCWMDAKAPFCQDSRVLALEACRPFTLERATPHTCHQL
jgi:hypothetical protein